MAIFLWIILAIVVFMIVVFIHELGHFITAKLSGVKVYEFGIGIPPKAITLFTDKSGTKYTLNWIPLGGFVRLKWEDTSEGLIEKDSLVAKPLWKKWAVILAGVFMNLVLAATIFSVMFFVWVKPLAINSKVATDIETKLIPTVEQAIKKNILTIDGLELSPVAWGIAAKAGIKEKDILFSIDDKKVASPEEMISTVANSKGTLAFLIRRNGKDMLIPIAPKDGKIQSYVGYNVTSSNEAFIYQYGFTDSIKYWIEETYAQSRMTLSFLWDIVSKVISPKNATDRSEATKSLSGPVAVGSMFVGLVTSHAGASVVLLILAVISINLAVFNLLPIPALDGGRFFFMVINSIVSLFYRKKTNLEYVEHVAHFVWFVLLIGLSIFVAYQDIARLIFK